MDDFLRIAREHGLRYPLMEPQDYAKLAFQSEFGPEHMVTDAADVVAQLLLEWEAAPASLPVPNPEPIGNGLCRFHLTAANPPKETAPVLARLFVQSAAAHRGTMEGLQTRLRLLDTLPVPGMAAWLQDYRKRGCPPVHHSETFRAAYHPHYRVVLTALAKTLPSGRS